MVELDSADLDALFQALADPTRRAILNSLAGGERSVSELAEPFAMSLAGAAKHVKVLEAAGLVRRSVRGRAHFCRLNLARLAAVHCWLGDYERFWIERLDALDKLDRGRDESS